MKYDQRRTMALWRFSVLGPLVSARLEYGDQRRLLEELAQRTYRHPSGRSVRLSARTLENWLYDYRKRGLEALEPNGRAAEDPAPSIDRDLADKLVRAKREKPRRSVSRLLKMAVGAGWVEEGAVSRSTLYRLLRAHGLSTRPPRSRSEDDRQRAPRERRSFLPEHAGDLWMGDVMHGPRVIAGSRLRKSYLISIVDVATRYFVASLFCLSEKAVDHEGVLRQAIEVFGLPRTYYVDRGAAYVADSLASICGELGVHLQHTRPRDAAAKGMIERWHRVWRDEVGDELDGPLSLDDLNEVHHAWLTCDYHRRVHSTTERAPQEHLLAELADDHLRALPSAADLCDVFAHRTARRVRADGTVQLHGRRFEVMGELCGQSVELRFNPRDPQARPRVFQDGAFVCDTVVLDLYRNAGRERRLLHTPAPEATPTGLDPLADLRRQLRSALPDEDEEIEIEIEIEDEDADADEPEEIEIEIDFDDTGNKDAREEDPR